MADLRIATAIRAHFPNGRPKALTEGLLKVRGRLDPRRPLPDFVVIGGQRCGTSSLYKYLSAHPLIVPSLRKEIRYFSGRYDEGEAWYRAHFASRVHRYVLARRHGRVPLTFEATPAYLFHPLAASRAAQVLPDVRLVAMLRNPVDRALSHYHHSVRRGWETLSFADALAAEPERLADHGERLAADPTYSSNDYLRYSYASRGFYDEHLKSWLARFGHDRLLVLRSEDLFERPVDTLHRLMDFVGLPQWAPDRLTNHSYGGAPRPVSDEMPASVRRELEDRFRASNQRLTVLVGDDVSW
jgi:hypothetical protein